jgi:hypothetical protein
VSFNGDDISRWLLWHVAVAARIRTLEQLDIGDDEIARRYFLGYGVDLGLVLRLPPEVSGISLRGVVRYSGYFNDLISSGGVLGSVGYFNGLLHVEAGVIYEQMPVKILRVEPFESDHRIGSREGTLLPFVRLGYQLWL